ncbi:hypothetical protein JHK87_001632 [Glycine soja]|nr:hypothetical protein JHK87_001632 [Glycine soja]
MDLRLWCPRLGSFGVVVLESVSGLKAVDFRQPEVLVVKKVHQFEVRKRPLEALADMGLNGEYNLKELMTLVSLGVARTRSDPKLRPTTRQIVYKGTMTNNLNVAIKHIINDDGNVDTFVREITSLSHVRHPNISSCKQSQFTWCQLKVELNKV